MVFWWTGRGFFSLLFLIGVFGVFGAIVSFTVGDVAFSTAPWLWGVGWVLAAIANWVGGSRINRRALNPFRGDLRYRLFYRARNKFLSLPMEVWSIPALVLGIALFVLGLF